MVGDWARSLSDGLHAVFHDLADELAMARQSRAQPFGLDAFSRSARSAFFASPLNAAGSTWVRNPMP
jgi:hypothetical protein